MLLKKETVFGKFLALENRPYPFQTTSNSKYHFRSSNGIKRKAAGLARVLRKVYSCDAPSE